MKVASIIKVGDIVMVKDEQHRLNEYQGQVVLVSRRGVKVWFGPEADCVAFEHPERDNVQSEFYADPPPMDKARRDPRTWHFPMRDLVYLEVCPNGWTTQTLAFRHIGKSMVNRIQERNDQFKRGVPCEVKGCRCKAVLRTITNVMGLAMLVDVCARHAERYGRKSVEILELK